MTRITAPVHGHAALLAALCIAAAGTPAIEAQVTDARVAEIVATSKADNILGGVAAEMVVGMKALDPTGDTARVAAAVRTHFAPDSLTSAVVRYLRDHADRAVFDELYAWVTSDSIRSIEAKADAAADAMTLEDYVQRLQTRPPSADEVAAATRFAELMKAGEFYVRFMTALQKNALETARAGGMNVPPVPVVPPEQRAAAVQQFTQLAIISFLQRFEPLTSEERNRLMEAYATRSGAWYVDAYTDAIVSALDDAGRKAIAALQ